MSTRHAWGRAPQRKSGWNLRSGYWLRTRRGFGELPACVTSKIRPAIAIVPTRSSGPGFGATVKLLVPEIVIQLALLVADQGQPVDAVTVI